MLSRVNEAPVYFTQPKTKSNEWTEIVRKAAGGFLTTAHHALLLFGATAITMLCMMFFNPTLADRLKTLSPFAETVKVQVATEATPSLTTLLDAPTAEDDAPQMHAAPTLMAADLKYAGSPVQQQRVTNWLSRRYHVANDATNMLVTASYSTARETKLDPLLILAVMCIESGLNPFAESPMGAQGLMQVMWKVHHARFDELGGAKSALNPVANIKVGALILHDLVVRGGSVEAGLKSYVGAGAMDNDAGYGAKVLAEYHRLQEVSIGKNVPTTSPVATNTVKQRPVEDANGSKPPVETLSVSDAASVVPQHVDVASQLALM
jgi:soluble lytic murein transglycosylase-like protein